MSDEEVIWAHPEDLERELAEDGYVLAAQQHSLPGAPLDENGEPGLEAFGIRFRKSERLKGAIEIHLKHADDELPAVLLMRASDFGKLVRKLKQEILADFPEGMREQ